MRPASTSWLPALSCGSMNVPVESVTTARPAVNERTTVTGTGCPVTASTTRPRSANFFGSSSCACASAAHISHTACEQKVCLLTGCQPGRVCRNQLEAISNPIVVHQMFGQPDTLVVRQRGAGGGHRVVDELRDGAVRCEQHGA